MKTRTLYEFLTNSVVPTDIVIRIRKFFAKLLRVIMFFAALYRPRRAVCKYAFQRVTKKRHDMKCDSTCTNAFTSSIFTEIYTAAVNHYSSINNIQKWKYF